MNEENYTVLLDEYIVIDRSTGYIYYHSDSLKSCSVFVLLNKALSGEVKILHI